MLEEILNKSRFTPGTTDYNNLVINYIDSLTLYWEVKTIFEREIYRFESKSKNPVILDLGGYIGISTLYFKYLYPTSSITTFEPDKKNFSVLERNIIQNNLSNVTLINAAVSNKNGLIGFSQKNDGGSINAKKGTTKVKTVKLSSYVNHKIDLIKINVEGSEYDILKEITPKLRFVDQLIIEYHNFASLPESLSKILVILSKNGFAYRITDYPNDILTPPFNPKRNYKYFNLIYAKKLSK